MANELSIIISAKDQASKKLSEVSVALDETGNAAEKSTPKIQLLQERWQSLAGLTAVAGVALRGVTAEMGRDVQAANELQSALAGLDSVARAYNINQVKAKQAAQDLAKDGLMTVADAATGLKNLLASGFSLDQSITLMKRFKDSAAFGRQSALGFGQAVTSATEGVKNGNSILVDNAGVTKNLSMMLTDAGYSAQDLMRATSDAGVRQALYNGIIKETNAQVGNAATLSDQFAGKQAKAQAQIKTLRQEIGTALQPALASLLQAVTPLIVATADWVSKHGELSAVLIIGITTLLGVATAIGGITTAIGILSPALPVLGATAHAAFGLITAGATGSQTAVGALASFVGSPAALAGWGVFAAAGVAAFVAIKQSADDTMRTLDNTQRAVENAARSNQAVIQQLNALIKNGTPEQKARAKATMQKLAESGAFASGGFTGRGGVNEVAGVVHKGEYVIPQSGVDQNTGLPKDMGSTVTYNGPFYFQTAEATREFFQLQDRNSALAAMGGSLVRV